MSSSRNLLTAALVILFATTLNRTAHAYARDVGIGVAAGLSYSPTKLHQGQLERTVGQGFAWGFFVDVPLTETFYIAPAAMLYEMDLGSGSKPVTDIDLNFKFIIPLSLLRLGAGFTAGLTNAAEQYNPHVGALAYASINVVANVDAFALLQYKRVLRSAQDVDDLHGYLGGMFRF